MRPITDVAADLGLSPADLDLYGSDKAKLTPAAVERLRDAPPGRLVLVTGINPTTGGEGKTTTSIGLTQAMRRRGVKATAALREPSIGPVMGIKGGGTGGGGSQIHPADEINLHFTGDLHAVTTANNLLAAAIDNSMFHGNPHGLDPRRITWRRCLDMNDRALRNIVVGLGGTTDGVSDGGPAFVHGGPFANIALGCNSLMATRAALATSDVTVTEAGFGSDLGAEKFFNIYSRIGGLRPEVAVIVATARALKQHGGVSAKELEAEDVGALRAGLVNLDAHIDNVQRHGLTPVVAVNRFPADSDAEIAAIVAHCRSRQVRAAEADPFGGGGEACLGLAEAVEDALTAGGDLRYLYDLDQPLRAKIEAIAHNVYGAGSVAYERRAHLTLRRMTRLGMDQLPVCIAKTQYSLSADPALRGRPTGHEFPVREVRPSAGAGFLVVIAGDIMTMPGLPKSPAATRFRLD